MSRNSVVLKDQCCGNVIARSSRVKQLAMDEGYIYYGFNCRCERCGHRFKTLVNGQSLTAKSKALFRDVRGVEVGHF